MDCEKFESTLIDELYDELDELTSAATKRHVAGCSRCAALLGGLRATRRIAVLPMVEVPAGLEERILAAARDAQKVVPIGSRVQRAVSWAGSWAMRPQTAMAAVFLLMIGSSVLLLKQHAKPSASAAMTVSEQGAPAMAASAAPPSPADEAVDLRQAAAAHGAIEPKTLATATSTPMGSAVAQAEPAAPNVGEGARAQAAGPLEEQLGPGAARPYADDKGSAAESALGSFGELKDAPRKDDSSNAGSGALAGAPRRAARPAPRDQAPPADIAPAAPPPPPAQAVQAAPQQNRTTQSGADFASGMDAYRSRNYADAVRTFDALSSMGDANAALWAARSVRESSGCAAAVTRFDQVATRAYGAQPGYDATLEGGRCYKALGSFDAARSRFVRLLTVPSHATRAQAELDAMSPKAAAAAKRPASAVEAAPPATQQKSQQQQGY